MIARRLQQLLLILALVTTPLSALWAASTQDLRNFALLMGLNDVTSFVETIETLRSDGYLPEYYLTKREARDVGWRPGSDLCDVAPGHSIGGDRFGNRERRLPQIRQSYYEADLDFNCGRRGAKRLVFTKNGIVYVTLDHYESFIEVPR